MIFQYIHVVHCIFQSRRAAESYEMRVHLLEKELKQQKEICISYHTEVLTLKKERDGVSTLRH